MLLIDMRDERYLLAMFHGLSFPTDTAVGEAVAPEVYGGHHRWQSRQPPGDDGSTLRGAEGRGHAGGHYGLSLDYS